VSSSSCDVDEAAERLLARALEVLAAEAPLHAAMLRLQLGRVSIGIALGALRLGVVADGEALRVVDAPAGAAVEVATTVPVVCALLDGETAVLAEIRAGRLRVRGAVDALAAASDAFVICMHGLVRCASSSSLVDELRLICQGESA
jgi:hypothetical protein